MRFGKELSIPQQSALTAEGLEWAQALFARARRVALRARVRAVSDRVAVRLAACTLFAGALAGTVGWALGLWPV